MINHIEIEISPIEEAGEALTEAVLKYFYADTDPDTIKLEIEEKIYGITDELKNDLFCLIEYPYVDKVYRDSYYTYYASKHAEYNRDCIRVSLFNKEISESDFLDPELHTALGKSFLGFFVLRPLRTSMLGRSIIHPDAFEENDFKLCRYQGDCLIYGVKLKVEGFPHSSQDGETISCAETTVWALMEYFGNKYPEYHPVLPSKIISTLEKTSFERQLPSTGLHMMEISYVVKELGLGTRTYSLLDSDLFELIDIYIESGIPVMASLSSNLAGHAVIIIGKQYKKIDFSTVKSREYVGFGKTSQYYESSQFAENYVLQDDNLMPYRLIRLDKPGCHYVDTAAQGYVIDSIVVPLHSKVYLEAHMAKELALGILKDRTLGFDFDPDFVFRFFLTSSRSFKSHIAQLIGFDNDLKAIIIGIKMPKFIWVTEIYAKESFRHDGSIAQGLVILDATEANEIGIDTLIFASYPNHSIMMDQNKFVDLSYNLENYCYYSNLK